MGNQKTKKFANPKKQSKKGTNLKKIEPKRRSSRSIDNSAMQVWQTNWEKFTQKKKSSPTSTAQTKKSRKTFFKTVQVDIITFFNLMSNRPQPYFKLVSFECSIHNSILQISLSISLF